jgi:hypothetical protein
MENYTYSDSLQQRNDDDTRVLVLLTCHEVAPRDCVIAHVATMKLCQVSQMLSKLVCAYNPGPVVAFRLTCKQAFHSPKGQRL